MEIGPSGTGKAHLLEAFGNTAIDDGMTVAWFTVETLGQLVRRHRADDTVTKAVKRVLKADLIVIDDFGLLQRVAGRSRPSTAGPRSVG